MRFSRNKFEQMPRERQQKKLLDYIDIIEENWEDEIKRQELLENLREYLGYFESSEYSAKAEALGQEIDRRAFLEIMVPIEQELSRDLGDRRIRVSKLDGVRERSIKLPVVLVLDNLRSAYNVGAIIRTAECFGVMELYLCGYTPDNQKVKDISMGTRSLVKVSHFGSSEEAIRELKGSGYTVYALETSEESSNIYEVGMSFPVGLILGNEALGVSRRVLEQVDAILEIPLNGWKNSLNVCSAAAIGISEINRRYKGGE